MLVSPENSYNPLTRKWLDPPARSHNFHLWAFVGIFHKQTVMLASVSLYAKTKLSYSPKKLERLIQNWSCHLRPWCCSNLYHIILVIKQQWCFIDWLNDSKSASTTQPYSQSTSVYQSTVLSSAYTVGACWVFLGQYEKALMRISLPKS